MGDRALVVFKDNSGAVSPIVYLHASGRAVPDRIAELKKLMLPERPNDAEYASARFVGLNHARNPDSPYSLGIINLSSGEAEAVTQGLEDRLADMSHGDAGFVVVDCADFSWRAYGGYLASKEAHDE